VYAGNRRRREVRGPATVEKSVILACEEALPLSTPLRRLIGTRTIMDLGHASAGLIHENFHGTQLSRARYNVFELFRIVNAALRKYSLTNDLGRQCASR
jgi:hypothetical protein